MASSHSDSAHSQADEKEKNRRDFSSSTKRECWHNAEPVPGRDLSRWRLDAVGNPVLRRLRNCDGCACHEYDHKVPHSKGGKSTVENCQILQTRVNRHKSDRTDLSQQQLKDYSCRWSLSTREMDFMEMALYGNVKREGYQCFCRSVNDMKILAKKMKEGIVFSDICP